MDRKGFKYSISYLTGILAIFIASLWPAKISAAGFSDETLHYVITYKWGLVHKDAADATLSLRGKGSNYHLTLTAKTKPWADKIFKVRDTLLCSVSKTGFFPISYSKISHEGGSYRRDDIAYSRSGNKVSAAVSRTKIDKKGVKSSSKNNFSASGQAYDMLSVFYWLRTLDYRALEQKKTFSTNIFSGSKVELLTIRYVGKERIKLRNGTQRDAIKITFSFTTEGRKKSSDNIEAWLSADSEHIPLQLIGKLPVGSVRVYLL
ncbi:MAG: DUF3108 domain-containing protein [Muribaculaceae bacterium]|nr:DUF3108 domain-containing protein [Muribaculaceae bacterium]